MSDTEKGLVAIDGKTLRGSLDRPGSEAAIHMVSAWASADELVLGQLAGEGKSNEITALPWLLDALDLEGATVTSDAEGCQKEIVAKTAAGGDDYVLALKANHPTLHEEVKLFWDDVISHDFRGIAHDYDESVEKDHGAENLSRLRRIALNLLKRETTEKHRNRQQTPPRRLGP